jgi:hypothetical protein
MALLQNGSNFSAEPYLRLGVTDVVSRTVPWSNNGRQLNLWWGRYPFSNLYGIPVPYAGGVAWIMPLVSGGLYTDLGVITGTGTLSLAPSQNMNLGVAIATGGSIVGSGDITVAGLNSLWDLLTTTAHLSGSGDMSPLPNMVGGAPLAIILTGSGDVYNATDLTMGSVLEALLTGSGDISSANLVSLLQLVATLSGSGNVSSADLKMGVYILSSLNGSGDVTSTNLTGIANMQCVINIGALPSAIDNASAVLGSLVDGQYTVQQILKIIAAVTAGSVTGGPSNPTFSNMENTSTVVTGTVDSNGNRTDVTLTP